MFADRKIRRTAGSALLGLLLAGGSAAASVGDSYMDVGEKVARGKSLSVDVAFVEDRGHVSVFELAGNYDKDLADGTYNIEPRREVARRFFEAHPDNYDFLIVFTTFEFETGEDVLAFYTGVRNDVLGIGWSVFDQSGLYGSAGRLQGYVDMAALTRYELNSLEPQFDDTLGTAAHEIMHRWGVRVEGPLGDRLLKSTDRAHWSFLVDTDASLMYGNDWQPNGDGTFTSVAIRKFYNPVELYLAGFYGPEEVPPFFVVDDPLVDPDKYPELGAVVEGTAEVVTIDDIIAANGPRIPAAADSQHVFRAAVLLLKGPGETVSDEVFASLESVRGELMKRFPVLTGGHGLIEVFPQVTTGFDTGSPEPVEGGDPRVGDASLADALSWLRAEQTAEGYWQDTLATRQRDTSAVVAVLDAYDPGFAGLDAALAWVGAEPNANTDALAHAVATYHRFGADATALQSELLTLQNADGGWGLEAERGSNPLDTALVSAALSGQEAAFAKAVSYLLSTQNADGGWGNHADGTSRTGVTTTVARVLAQRPDVPGEALAKAAAWLGTKQNPDGGFGDSPSTVHDTANVLLALLTLDATDAIDRTSATGFLRGRQAEDGSWAGSRFATALAVDALKRSEGLPNLAFAAPLAAEPAAPRDGERVRWTAKVTNNGGEPTLPGSLRFYEGDPLSGGEPFAEVALPPLARREQATVTAYWESFDRPGTRTIYAVLDPDHAVEELSETDNVASLTLEVTPAPEGVDLAVGDADIAVSPGAPGEIPSLLSLSAVVRNLGKADAGPVRVALWLGEPETGTLVDTVELVLLQRSSAVANFTCTVTAPGTTLWTVELDPDDAVAEDDETNNRAVASVTTQPTIDLEVTPADLVLDGAALLGLDAQFRVTVHNRGTLDAPSTAVRLEVLDGGTSHLVQVANVRLGPGASQELSIPWRVDRLGELVLRAIVDPDGVVIETDEDNNSAELSFLATELVGLNLSVDHAEMAFDPEPGLQGAPVTVSAVVRNGSDVDLADVEVAFYEGDPDQGGSLLGSFTETLLAGEARNLAVTTEPLPTGDGRTYFVIVDPQNLIDELEEADNRAFRVLSVLSLPDLAVSASAVGVEPSAPEPGTAATVTVEVANRGGQTANDVLVRLTDSFSSQVLEQVVPFVYPDSVEAASFAWTFPPTSETVALSVAVDPDGTIDELVESNNGAERFVQPAGRDSEHLSHRYFSPNGDGVRDTTVFFFSLAAPADVVIEVVDERGTLRRRHSGPGTAGVTQGSFEWDGRDDAGVVLRDGDYRIRAVDDLGGVLAEAVVTLDLNRLPLTEVFDTPYQITTNITCDLALTSNHNFALPRPYDKAFFMDGIRVTVLPLGGQPKLLFYSFYGLGPTRLAVSDDGKKIAAEAGPSVIRTANADGSSPIVLDASRYFGFRPTTHDLVWARDSTYPRQIVIQPLDGGPRWFIEHEDHAYGQDVDSRYFRNMFSSDGRWLFFFNSNSELGIQTEEVVDLENGVSNQPWSGLVWVGSYAWNSSGNVVSWWANRSAGYIGPRGLEFFITPDSPVSRGWLAEDDETGIAQIPEYSSLELPKLDTRILNSSSLTWSSNDTEVLLRAEIEEKGPEYGARWGYLERFDLKLRQREVIAYLRPLIYQRSFTVSTWDGSRWIDRGKLHYGNGYSEETLDLTGQLPDADGEYKVRIRQSGLDAAHVEKVLLLSGEGTNLREVRPASAALTTGGDVLSLVVRHDHDVLDLHEKEMEVRWTAQSVVGLSELGMEGTLQLAVVAREEDFSSLPTRPFDYPEDGKGAYEILVDGLGGLVVDGQQTGDDHLEHELFDVMTRPDTGHPAARVYGYATSDAEHLYAALDFTVDNTRDGDRDWAAVEVRTAEGWREFRVGESDGTWGRVGFVRTGKVHHIHKYYEFQIPLAEIGAQVGDALELRFRAYGTAAQAEATEPFFLPREGKYPAWIPGTRQVFYSDPYDGTNWLIHMDEGNRFERVLEDFTSLDEPIFLDGGRKLLFRDGRDILNPQHECYNPEGEFSFFLLESAANLGARLEAAPVDEGLSFELRGTAADRNFKSFQLEYASEEVPGFWTPLGPAETYQVFDDVFTTWTPPHSGWFRVRLRVEDLAGNVATVERRLSYGATATAPISDLSAAPRFISPNGDGVQDATTIHYRVQEPVHLEFRIFDSRNERVRTFERDHSVVGEEHTLVWDGRDENGFPVADGDYRIEVLRYELSVVVDTRGPTGSITFTPALTTNYDGEIEVAPGLVWCLGDANPQSGVLEVGEGAEPQVWSEVAAINALNLCPRKEKSWSLEPAQVIDRRYRIRLRDTAGNEGIVAGGLAAPELIVEQAAVNGGDLKRLRQGGTVSVEELSSLTLAVAETSRFPLRSARIQFRSSADELWQEVPLTEIYEPGALTPQLEVPRLAFLAQWPDAALTPGFWQVRVQAFDEKGSEIDSNTLTLSNQLGLVHGGLVSSVALGGPFGAELAEALDQAALDPEAVRVLWAYSLRTVPLMDVSMLVSSEDDPRFAGGKSLLPAGSAGQVYVFVPDDLEACLHYSSWVSGRDIQTGDPVPSSGISFQIPCLDLHLHLSRGAGTAACGETPSQTATATLVAKSLDGVDLQSLTLAVDDPANVVFNVNRPVDDLVYTYDFDTGAMAERYHRLYARLVNEAGQETLAVEPLVVDRTPPEVVLTSPPDGETVCAVPTPYLRGTVTDLGGLRGSRVSYLPAGGAAWLDDSIFTEDDVPREGGLTQLSQRIDESLADLVEKVDGKVRLRVEVEDWGGNVGCEEVSFTLDTQGLAQVSIHPAVFSPNGDGVGDTTNVSISVDEPSTVDAEVYAAVLEGEGDTRTWTPVGGVVARPFQGLTVFDFVAASWDGQGIAGSLEDGLYLVVFRVRDGCGNEAVVEVPVSVDTSPPWVDLSSPPPGAQLSDLVVGLSGWVEDPNLEDWRVDAGAGVNPTTWRQVADGVVPRHNERLGEWSTFGESGAYTLRLSARDRAGNQAEVQSVVDLAGSAELVSSLEAVPDLLSPDGDGRLDTAAIRFTLVRDAAVTLEVRRGDATRVVTLLDGEALPAGAAIRTWNGQDETGVAVADGAYQIWLSAEDSPVRQEVTSIVEVDSTPPAVAILRPISVTPGGGPVLGTVLDDHLDGYQVQVAEVGSAQWVDVGQGNAAVDDGVLARLPDLPEGGYTLRVEAFDAAQNRSEALVSFTVDNTPPRPHLDAPEAGALLSAAGGLVSVVGSVDDENPLSFRVEYGAGESPASWIEIAHGEGAQSTGQLAGWNLTGLADGAFVLRLFATDRGGLTAHAEVKVILDNSPPTAAIDQPADGAYLNGPTSIVGTATDAASFQGYSLEIAPGSAPADSGWSEIARLASPVAGGKLLDWQVQVPDGLYSLRLSALDRAGNRSEDLVEVNVDRTPPAAPTGLAVAETQTGSFNVRWDKSPEPDVDVYRLLRDGNLVTEQISNTHFENNLTDGSYVYTVTAVDKAGNESAPSEPVPLSVNETPPAARIRQPDDGDRVGGLVEVRITAYSDDDFDEYRLFLDPGTGSQLLLRSSTPVDDHPIPWDTTALADGPVVLRLEAEDVFGNLASDEIALLLDNTPPAPPTGLSATASGADVELAWNPNAEDDLQGYLLYRDGQLVNATGGVDDLRDFALPGPSYSDLDQADGKIVYRVAAVDRTGNPSGLSEPAEVTLENRPPHAVIVEPKEGEATDGELYVLAVSADRDVAAVDFAYRASGEAEWTALKSDEAEPFDVLWDPEALGRPYGPYELRAVASDGGGKVDPSPETRRFVYKDLAPPPAVTSAEAWVDGGEVTLTWPAVEASDLAGYHVERAREDGSVLRLTIDPVAGTTFVDSDAPDADLLYTVVAVDVYDNDAEASPPAPASVYTPQLTPPATPTTESSTALAGRAVTAGGEAVAGATVTVTVVHTEPGTTSEDFTTTGADGSFTVEGVPLEHGLNEIQVVVTDALGQHSRPAPASVVSTPPPSAPTGLVGVAAFPDVELHWNPNPEDDLLGYRVLSDGFPKTGLIDASELTATASSVYNDLPAFGPQEALSSSSSYSYWSPQISAEAPVDGQWWAATWSTPRRLSTVWVTWYYPHYAIDYDLQVLDGDGWTTAAEVRNNSATSLAIDLPEPLVTGVRIVLHTIRTSGLTEPWPRLRRVNLSGQPILVEPAWVEPGVGDGTFTFQVTAVNQALLESEPSEPVTVEVGDTTPPDPVTLSATVDGSSVELSWTASDAPDFDHFEVYRDGWERRYYGTGTSFVDNHVKNGLHPYVVNAYDALGNFSGSNEVAVTVAVEPPAAPVGLVVTSVPYEGRSVALAWQPGGGPAPYAYSVARAMEPGGPFEIVKGLSATTYLDTGLTNGVTYSYVVYARDVLGNLSEPSNEVSATPERVVPTPSFSYPAAAGASVEVDSRVLDRLTGFAEPETSVLVSHQGSVIATVETSAYPATVVGGYSGGSRALLSPNGRWGWVNSTYTKYVLDFETGSSAYGYVPSYARWMPSGSRVVFGSDGWLRTYGVEDGASEDLLETDLGAFTFYAVVPSPDAKRFVVIGQGGKGSGLFRVDAETGESTQLVDVPPFHITLDTVTVSDDGRFVAYENGFDKTVELVDLETGVWTVVSANLPYGDAGLDFSPASDTLVYTRYDASNVLQLWIYDLADGSQQQLTSDGVNHRKPQFLPDGRLLFVSYDSVVLRLDLLTGESEQVYSFYYWGKHFSLSKSGHAVFVQSSRNVRLTLPGHFELQDLSLDPGENRFTVIAQELSGLQSLESKPLRVLVPPADRADLEVTEPPRTTPAYPVAGEPAGIQVTVRNAGLVRSAATTLKLVLIRGDGVTTLGSFGFAALEPGEEATVSGTVTFLDPGVHTLVATADPNDAVPEASEDNNRVERPLLVLDAAAPAVFARTDAAEYEADEDVAVLLDAVNGGTEPLNGRLEVLIEDADGYPVATLYTVPSLSLAAGESLSDELTWNTGTTFAGTYHARATLWVGTSVAGEAVAAFEIGSSVRIEAAVETDRTHYDEGETVRISGSVSYLSGNVVLTGATARLRVVDVTGKVRGEWQRPLGELLPASSGAVYADWPSAGAPAAFYSAQLEVYSGDDLLGSSEAPFALGNVGPARLVASKSDDLALDADANGVPGPGDTLRYEIAVTNIGGQPASEVKLTDLVPQATSIVAASLTTTHGDVVSEDPVEVEIGGLAPGETAVVTFEVTLDDPLPEGLTEIENQGTVTSAEQPAVVTDDPDLGGDADKTVTSVGGAPEIVAEMTWTLGEDADSDGVASPGDTLSYAVSVKNVGSGPATGVGFGAEVPQYTSLVPGSVQTDAGSVETEAPILVVLGELAAGAEATVTYDVTVDNPIAVGVVEITNQGVVVSDQLGDVLTDDPSVGGDADPTVTPIAAAPVLTVEKTATLFADTDGDGLASPGDELLYRVEVENSGNTAATLVHLDDPVGDDLTVVAESVQSSHGTVLGELPVAVEIGEVAVGEPAVVTFRVRIDDPFPVDVLEVTNQASVASAELGTIPSNDPSTPQASDPTVTPVYITPDVNLDDAVVAEDGGTATVVVRLSEPGNRPVTLAFATTNGTGLAGYDYEEATGSLEIAAGETAAEISVALLDDTLDEADETFTVTLTETQGARVADGEATVTIRDDDPPPVLTMSGVSVGESAGSVAFVLSLSTESSLEIRVEAATADGTAVAGHDYTATSQSVVFPAGTLGAQVVVAVTDDVVDELDETFELLLYDPQNVVLADAAAVATIVDDDEATLSIDDVEAEEGDEGSSEASFTVELATPSDREITVDYSTQDGTAVAGREYEAVLGTLIFAPGDLRTEIAVPIVGDTVLEDEDKTFTMELTNAVNTTIEDGTGVCTIHDDEVCPGPELLTNPGAEARVRDGVIPGWTPLLGDDWQVSGGDPAPYEGTAYFDAGRSDLAELYQDVDVRAYSARIAGGGQLFAFRGRVRTRDETPPDVARVVVEYRDAANAYVLDAFDSGEIASPDEWREVADVRAAPVGTGWIRVRLLATRFADDEWNDGYFDALALASRRAPVVTIDDAEVYEGHTGTTPMVFTVELSCTYEHEVAAAYSTADGTAIAGEDYLETEGALSLPAGETSFEVTVPVVADEDSEEPVEWFTVELGELQSAGSPVLLDGSGRGDIRDDDFCPLSPGYWKNHREDWVVEELRIGGVWYDDLGMMEHLTYGGPDASSRLAHHLVATLLNLARGSDPYILPDVEAADAFLAEIPPGSDPVGADRDEANAVKDLLDDYNNTPCEDGGGGNGHGNGKGGR